ncbi:TetR family transcriptional regulator [Patulibacter sp. SYSU D01012]|uniref:TetR family transcriptional regulator n=1 Tax=Patulibacter sp. SYSU D01012 TaxID=2817381 RepID=UPI001B314F89|nr:TetR family transcriptional regulator [Patulibacter sp. SYSU D01012]
MSATDHQRREELLRLQREQVLRGVAEALAAKGWSATTIADIAAAARASRSTVYAHFADKDDALLALHDVVLARLGASLLAAHERTDRSADWRTRLAATTTAHLEALASASPGERASLLEVASVGPAARRARREGLDRFAALVADTSVDLAAGAPDAEPLTPALALAAVAAVHELVQRAADDGPDAIRALAPAATDVLARLMRRPAAAADPGPARVDDTTTPAAPATPAAAVPAAATPTPSPTRS